MSRRRVPPQNQKGTAIGRSWRYRAHPRLTAGAIGDLLFIKDSRAQEVHLHRIPTQHVTSVVHDVVRRIIAASSDGEWVEIEDLPGGPLDVEGLAALEQLVRAGYVDRASLQEGLPGNSGAPAKSITVLDLDGGSYVPNTTFFNAPVEAAQQGTDVAIFGLPVSTTPTTTGCRLGPAWLRGITHPVDPFSMFKDGLCSEMFTLGGRPEILCQGLVVGDFGDISPEGMLLRDYFAAVSGKVESLISRSLGALFIGGDHAATIPLVKAYHGAFQDLQMVVLDAHSDLFYSQGARFHHSSVTRCVLDAGVRGVRVLGLHSFLDQRASNLAALPADTFGEEGLALHTLTQTREMLRLESLGKQLRLDPARPVYISIDLDVLSDSATGGMVSTPMGHGLEWVELFEFIRKIFQDYWIVACDVVECDPTRRTSSGQD